MNQKIGTFHACQWLLSVTRTKFYHHIQNGSIQAVDSELHREEAGNTHPLVGIAAQERTTECKVTGESDKCKSKHPIKVPWDIYGA